MNYPLKVVKMCHYQQCHFMLPKSYNELVPKNREFYISNDTEKIVLRPVLGDVDPRFDKLKATFSRVTEQYNVTVPKKYYSFVKNRKSSAITYENGNIIITPIVGEKLPGN